MKVVFVKKKQPQRVISDIKKATKADKVTTEKHAYTKEFKRNKYGRPEPK